MELKKCLLNISRTLGIIPFYAHLISKSQVECLTLNEPAEGNIMFLYIYKQIIKYGLQRKWSIWEDSANFFWEYIQCLSRTIIL